ncbi:MAG: electron transfer flavoprotein subunit alpha/FixB family protein [Candidatus Delongbacteria bacterium]|nr:electron transfer flavoprotein subunit alpha/FixB family protein [Candidatus Delongbacteria bacterium]
MSSILIYLESHDGKLKSNAAEVATAGRKLATAQQKELVAVVIGEVATDELGNWGISRAIRLSGGNLADYSGDVWAAELAQLVSDQQADTVLMMASSQGRDLSPRLGALTGVTVIADVISLENQDGTTVGLRPVFANKAQVLVRPTGELAIFTLRPKAFTPEVVEAVATTVESRSAAALDALAIVRELAVAAGAKIDLTEADVIVSGGRGMGGSEKYDILEQLAEKLGGVVGASRAAVDAGWRPHSDQVGQTGKTVAPTLYIACGISGAIQHLAGMSSSRFIVAINKDPEAPIFKVADYGIVGNLFEVVPALNSAI